ncbi:MAG: DUF3109 family protein [Bacteroidia bacterium]|nr:DUF3109 family protein [Bacteroidia bacterium]
MLAIGEVLVSEEIISKQFVCDLHACKGACCVHGDSGAPLYEHEKELLAKAYPATKKYIPAEGIAAIEAQGLSVIDSDGDLGTPLMDGKHCAYTYFEQDGTAKCAFEKAYKNGETEWYKPISCHLYPIRLIENKRLIAANYDKWSICAAACTNGEKLKVRVYQFLKEPLIRKFGEPWYNELCETATAYIHAHEA